MTCCSCYAQKYYSFLRYNLQKNYEHFNVKFGIVQKTIVLATFASSITCTVNIDK